jgi:methyl-accepting chemotaxis protein
MNQLNQITQQNASASEELAATAEEMNAQAQHLQEVMAFFVTSGSKTVKTAHTSGASRGPGGTATKPASSTPGPKAGEFVAF